MKCKRCGTEMKREKWAYHSYGYTCPKCGLRIGRRKDENEEYKQAYEIMTGKAE